MRVNSKARNGNPTGEGVNTPARQRAAARYPQMIRGLFRFPAARHGLPPTARFAAALLAGAAFFALASFAAQGPALPKPPDVFLIALDDTIEPVTAEYVESGIRAANDRHASAVLLQLSTPGGLDTSMREIIRAIIDSRVPVITYVAPSGSRAASAGFFILLSGDIAAMSPGTNTGAAHPVAMGVEMDAVMTQKVVN